MKVIPQSFEILPESNDLVKQIGSRARICYKSEEKEDETGFVKGIIKSGHNSCLEMATITLAITPTNATEFYRLLGSNYIITDFIGKGVLICTGSIRAWREFIISYSPSELTRLLLLVLKENSSNLFWEGIGKNFTSNFDMSIKKVDPQDFPKDRNAKRHTHVAVKFITNRAVSHELVRHRPVAFLQESQRYCAYNKDKFGGEVTFIEPSAFFDVNLSIVKNYPHMLWKKSCEYAETAYLSLLREGATPQAARLVLPNSCKTEIIMYCSLAQWEHIFNMRTTKQCDPSMQEAMIPVHEEFKKLYPGMFDNCQRSVG